jgi:hypothetical protein
MGDWSYPLTGPLGVPSSECSTGERRPAADLHIATETRQEMIPSRMALLIAIEFVDQAYVLK